MTGTARWGCLQAGNTAHTAVMHTTLDPTESWQAAYRTANFVLQKEGKGGAATFLHRTAHCSGCHLQL